MAATEYEYTLLKDLKSGDSTYNVYGVVKFFKEPKRTRGPDWNMTVVLTDESLGWDGKVTFSLFMKDPSSLPSLSRIGAVVRFHRVRVNQHGGQLQGLSRPGFAALVFDRDGSDPTSTKPNFTFSEKDRFKVNNLIKWSKPFVADELSQMQKKICDVKPNQYFDLACQIIGYSKVGDSQVVLKVWDGTKPTENLQILKVLEDDDGRLQYDDVNYPHVQDFLVDVSVFDNHVKATDDILLGDFVIFQNLHSFVPIPFRNEQPPSKVELCLHQGTTYGRTLKVMNDADSRKLQQKLNTILQNAEEAKPESPNREVEPMDTVDSQEPQQTQQQHPTQHPCVAAASPTKQQTSDPVSAAFPALEELLSMELASNIALWAQQITAPKVPEHIPCLQPAFEHFQGQSCRLNATISIPETDVFKTVLLYCQHCKFLSRIPNLVRQGFRSVKFASSTNTRFQSKSTTKGNNTKCGVVTLPLTQNCEAVHKIQVLRLQPSDWLQEATPVLEMGRETGDYYLCPQCAKKKDEDDPCLLKYYFYLTMEMEDSTGKLPVLIWTKTLLIGGVDVCARDVAGSADVNKLYRNWLTQFTSGRGEFECLIKVHRANRQSRGSKKLYQLMKVVPKS